MLAGLEFNAAADELNPIANIILQVETATAPTVSLGTSSDRIGTMPGNQAYYVTVAKGFPDYGLAPYVSINYSEADEEINFPFGANWRVDEVVSLMYMHDGERPHGLITLHGESYTVSFIAVWFEHPGVSVSWGF